MAKEYIEREAAIKALYFSAIEMERSIMYDSNIGVPKEDIEDVINEIPAADVVEVRHGKWIKGRKEKLYYNDDMSGFYDFPVTCSVCKFDITDEGFYETDYCPNCGAKMDGKDIDVTTKTDQVEVVRCGQCRHATDDIIVEGVCYCHKIQQGMFVDGFCSYGERKCEDDKIHRQ